MKYIIIGSIVYIVGLIFIFLMLYKNGKSREKVSDKEYQEFLIYMKELEQEKLNKRNKKKRR